MATSRRANTSRSAPATQPGGSQDGKGGDGSVSGVNKVLNNLLHAAGVTKTAERLTDDFGETSLPKGILTELKA